MGKVIDNFIIKTKAAVKNWWLLLFLGVLFITMGIVVFINPAQSYFAMALVFGIAMLTSGTIHLIFSFSNSNFFVGRGWTIVCGFLDIILGVILCSNILLAEAALPFIIAFFFMYKGIMMIGLGSDFALFHLAGGITSIILGSLLMIFSFLIIIKPVVGSVFLIIITGITFIISGIQYCYFAFKLKNIHKKIEESYNF